MRSQKSGDTYQGYVFGKFVVKPVRPDKKARITLDTVPHSALGFMSKPTDLERAFGKANERLENIKVMAMLEPTVGGIHAYKIRNMARGPDHDFDLMAHFAQYPLRQRFSIVAFEQNNIYKVASFCTTGWRFERDIEADGDDPDCGPNDYTLTIHPEMIFVDADLRGQGYGLAFNQPLAFWAQAMILEIDRQAAAMNLPCRLGITLTADAVNPGCYGHADRLLQSISKSLKVLMAQRRFTQITTSFIGNDIWPV